MSHRNHNYFQWSICALDLFSLFNGILTFVGYLMPKPFSKKHSNGTIGGAMVIVVGNGHGDTCSNPGRD